MKRYNGAEDWLHPAPPGAVPDGAELESAAPARAADLVADVAVPFLQAVVTGALVGSLLTLALAELVPDYDGDLLLVWAGATLTISTLAWLFLLLDTRKLLWAIERLTGADLDGNQVAGPVVRVEVTSGRREVYFDLPGTPEALATLARGVLNGRSFAEDSWSGRGAPFSRGEFRQIRDALIERGLAVWRNPQAKAQGVELTAAGKSVFQRLAEVG